WQGSRAAAEDPRVFARLLVLRQLRLRHLRPAEEFRGLRFWIRVIREQIPRFRGVGIWVGKHPGKLARFRRLLRNRRHRSVRPLHESTPRQLLWAALHLRTRYRLAGRARQSLLKKSGELARLSLRSRGRRRHGRGIRLDGRRRKRLKHARELAWLTWRRRRCCHRKDNRNLFRLNRWRGGRRGRTDSWTSLEHSRKFTWLGRFLLHL